MANPEDILAYWLEELTPADWYRGGDDLDQMTRERFEADWNEAREGHYGLWLTYPAGMLAFIILTDQFSRNMFRGTAQSFELDPNARAAAKVAISRGWDMRVEEPARQFFYMPLMHSESLCDQDRCVRLMLTRMPKAGADNLLHAKAHREIIRQFGRFPFRNEALGRETTPPEAEFIETGGYRTILESLRAAEAA